MEEIDSGSGDTVNGVDRILVGMGLASLALLPTYGTLIAQPGRLAAHLDPTSRTRSDLPTLGPGVFFVASLLFTLLVGSMIVQSVDAPSPETVKAAQQTGASYAIGTVIGTIMKSLMEALSSGDFWNAVAVALPIFGYAVLLAVPLRFLVGLSSPGWTAAHSVGASLYMVGGLMVGITLSATFAVLAGLIMPTVAAVLISMVGVLAAFAMMAVQAYAFGSTLGSREGAGLGLGSVAVPLMALAILAVCAVMASALGGTPDVVVDA